MDSLHVWIPRRDTSTAYTPLWSIPIQKPLVFDKICHSLLQLPLGLALCRRVLEHHLEEPVDLVLNVLGMLDHGRD